MGVKPYYAIKSVFPPGIANLPDGRRFAVSGVWIELGPEVTQEMVDSAWEPLYPRKENFSPFNVYEVISSRNGETYKVTEHGGVWECSCPGFEFHRKTECKHIKQKKSEICGKEK
jgi:hypothetical protein